MAQVTWTPTARRHLIAVCDEIAQHSIASAEKFADRAIAKVELLREHPYLGQAVLHDTEKQLRQLVVDRSVIYYRVISEQVEILAVFDGRRELHELIGGLPDPKLN